MELKKANARITALETALKSAGVEPPTDDDEEEEPESKNPHVARLQRELADLKGKYETDTKERQKAEGRARDASLSATVSDLIAKAGLHEPDASAALLRNAIDIGADNVAVFKIKGDDGKAMKVTANLENLEKYAAQLLIPQSFFPAKGQAGSGSRTPTSGASGALDLDRALGLNGKRQDMTYYMEHEAEVDALMSRKP